MCIVEFAKRTRMPRHIACEYLNKYGGLAFLEECYPAEHHLSLNDAINDIKRICRRNGGTF